MFMDKTQSPRGRVSNPRHTASPVTAALWKKEIKESRTEEKIWNVIPWPRRPSLSLWNLLVIYFGLICSLSLLWWMFGSKLTILNNDILRLSVFVFGFMMDISLLKCYWFVHCPQSWLLKAMVFKLNFKLKIVISLLTKSPMGNS